MSGLVTIDGGGLRRFGAQMRRLAAETKKTVNAGLLTIAKTAAVEAKASASEWSDRIPPSIRAGGTGARVYVRAGGPKAPGAAAFEHHGGAGQFRHPVFGDKGVWVSQQARPYLTPAVNKTSDAGGDAIAKAIIRKIEEG